MSFLDNRLKQYYWLPQYYTIHTNFSQDHQTRIHYNIIAYSRTSTFSITYSTILMNRKV